MNKYFDEQKWNEVIQKLDWYFFLVEEYKRLKELRGELSAEENKEVKKLVYDFFEKNLSEGKIALGDTGKNFDRERKPIDTIVIHHTHNPPGMSPERLSAITLVRLYAPFYANPYLDEDKDIQGKSVYSGHFRSGKQVFYPYHWIVKTNGRVDRLLSDEEIGWQAGNWDINCRSVAIVLDNNYEDSTPSDAELASISEIIKEYYNCVPKERIFGHREINSKTTCPGNLFLGGWKQKLIGKLQ